ncbi:Transcriptional regulator, MerR family [Olavius sp. associated proteobacterium Delta 1]|nr:Transcriptional regulator, MerR family [Olavius sp. associated proteobacterium Delta 1]
MEKLSIGELARQANVNIETIRYYERRGLISEPPRNKSGHRRYSHEAVKRTDFKKGHVCGVGRDCAGRFVLFYTDPDDSAWDNRIECIYAIPGFGFVTGLVYHDRTLHSFLFAVA